VTGEDDDLAAAGEVGDGLDRAAPTLFVEVDEDIVPP